MKDKIKELEAAGHIVRLNRKPFILYSGLLTLAHELGLSAIEEEILECDWENGRFVVRATVTTKTGSYIGHGDATKYNCGKMILPHALRMASTRAKARALRDAVGLGITAFEELGDYRE
jgi:hypothetical protein